MTIRKSLLLIFSILTIFFLLCSPSSSQENDTEEEFSYDSESPNGPQHWGDLHEDWAICSKGRRQSPIYLSDDKVHISPYLGPLRLSYLPGNTIIKNRGHDIMLEWLDEAGALWIQGTPYALKQLHWHSPSEHIINGLRYDLEMHMVHQTTDGNIAVIGFLYAYGKPDPFLAKLEPHIKKIVNTSGVEEIVGLVDPRDAYTERSKDYYRYNKGSLTTPPCTEGVIWTVLKKVRNVSKEQVTLLRQALHEPQINARPLQQIHGRLVKLYAQPLQAEY